LPSPNIPTVFIGKDVENFRVQAAAALPGANLKPFVDSRGDISYRHIRHNFSNIQMTS
jgi:hypothetical protein